MTIPTEITDSLAVKLASLVVHAEEMDLASPASYIDLQAMQGIATDPEVAEWLAQFDPVLLPVKR